MARGKANRTATAFHMGVSRSIGTPVGQESILSKEKGPPVLQREGLNSDLPEKA
jgi:hypothetical protein